MQAPDHGQSEMPLARQDLGDARSRSQNWLELRTRHAALFHGKLDGGDGVGRIDRPVPVLIIADHQRKEIEAIAFA